MAYADFVASDEYPSKPSGAEVAVLLYDESNVSDPIISGTTGISSNDDFESIPIEEAGNEGVDEIAQGRHTNSVTIQGFWSAERNDQLPTRQSFIGKKYVVMEVIADDRANAGTVLNVYTGCVCNRYAQNHGARGAKTLDLGFLSERRYSGQEWATLTGT